MTPGADDYPTCVLPVPFDDWTAAPPGSPLTRRAGGHGAKDTRTRQAKVLLWQLGLARDWVPESRSYTQNGPLLISSADLEEQDLSRATPICAVAEEQLRPARSMDAKDGSAYLSRVHAHLLQEPAHFGEQDYARVGLASVDNLRVAQQPVGLSFCCSSDRHPAVLPVPLRASSKLSRPLSFTDDSLRTRGKTQINNHSAPKSAITAYSGSGVPLSSTRDRVSAQTSISTAREHDMISEHRGRERRIVTSYSGSTAAARGSESDDVDEVVDGRDQERPAGATRTPWQTASGASSRPRRRSGGIRRSSLGGEEIGCASATGRRPGHVRCNAGAASGQESAEPASGHDTARRSAAPCRCFASWAWTSAPRSTSGVALSRTGIAGVDGVSTSVFVHLVRLQAAVGRRLQLGDRCRTSPSRPTARRAAQLHLVSGNSLARTGVARRARASASHAPPAPGDRVELRSQPSGTAALREESTAPSPAAPRLRPARMPFRACAAPADSSPRRWALSSSGSAASSAGAGGPERLRVATSLSRPASEFQRASARCCRGEAPEHARQPIQRSRPEQRRDPEQLISFPG